MSLAERSSALDSSSGVVRIWVQISAWPVAALVSLSKTLDHNYFVLWMGRKAVGPVFCVMHVKEPRTLIVKEKGLAPVFLDSRAWAPSRVDMCTLQIFCIIIITMCGKHNTTYMHLFHTQIACAILCWKIKCSEWVMCFSVWTVGWSQGYIIVLAMFPKWTPCFICFTQAKKVL